MRSAPSCSFAEWRTEAGVAHRGIRRRGTGGDGCPAGPRGPSTGAIGADELLANACDCGARGVEEEGVGVEEVGVV